MVGLKDLVGWDTILGASASRYSLAMGLGRTVGSIRDTGSDWGLSWSVYTMGHIVTLICNTRSCRSFSYVEVVRMRFILFSLVKRSPLQAGITFGETRI